MPTISMFFWDKSLECTVHRVNIIHLIFMPIIKIFKAIVDINTCEITEGNLPKRQAKMVVAWAEIHQEELLADWELASKGELPV